LRTDEIKRDVIEQQQSKTWRPGTMIKTGRHRKAIRVGKFIKGTKMKTYIFLILWSVTISVSFAQPGFTSADMPNIGDQDSIMILQYHPITNNLDTETGNSYTWNFSSLPFHVQNFIDIDSFRVKQHFVSAGFPGATIEEYKAGITGQTVNLYSYKNDTLIIHRLGSTASGWALGPIASIAFPIAFNNASIINANIYTGSGFGILVGQRKTTTLYDGFGTLNMPNGKTYNNVFRVKLVEKDTNYVTNTATVATSYIWYKQGGQIPLLRLVYSGASNLYFVFGSKGKGTTSGINDLNNFANLTIYPNPSNGQFQFSIDDFHIDKNSKIEIFNTQGLRVYQSEITNAKSDIDLSNQTCGIYLVKVYNGQTILWKQIVIR
jgi:hypothetical protein